MGNFSKYASYYNLFYENKDYKGEAEFISQLIRENKADAISVLNMGCGTGRHDIELSKLGYYIMGVDMSEDMISIAQKNTEKLSQPNISYQVGDIRNFQTKKKYEVVLALFHVVSYQNSNQDLLNAFQTMADALERGGICIFDAWHGPGVLRDLPVVRVKRINNKDMNITRIAEPLLHPAKNVVDVNYEIQIQERKSGNVEIIRELHPMRYLFAPEVEYYLSICGLKLLKCIDCNSLKEADFNSWTAYFIAIKYDR